ncbi:hypothetical protein DY000_02006405 [Brassica cretica]|uniref:Uncharacterized protein n=1 Tax=Brassica cretica TaxID=69181 RepID=A0ABQ7CCQ9_BRACR|nr:hypothetical protein DY000_02006405 [Brassica cretica]
MDKLVRENRAGSSIKRFWKILSLCGPRVEIIGTRDWKSGDSDRVSAFCTGYGIEPSVDGSVMTGPRLVLDGGMVLLTGYGAVEPNQAVSLCLLGSRGMVGLVIKEQGDSVKYLIELAG